MPSKVMKPKTRSLYAKGAKKEAKEQQRIEHHGITRQEGATPKQIQRMVHINMDYGPTRAAKHVKRTIKNKQKY